MVTKEPPPEVGALAIGLGAPLAAMPSYPAFWGFFGALVYGLTQLVAIYAAEGVITRRQQALAWSRLAISLIFGAFGAAALAAAAVRWSRQTLDISSASFGVGLLGSGLWPVAETFLRTQGPKLLAGMKGFSAAFNQSGQGPNP